MQGERARTPGSPDSRFDDTFVPRMTDEEVKDIVYRIGPLRMMFHSATYDGDLFGARDYTDGILYLSRVNVEAHHPETRDSNRPDNEKDAEDTKAVHEIKSESANTASFNTEKKRRFAMSLATLASKPIKRESMCKDGAIQSLIKLAVIDDMPIRRCCAAAFSYLASEPKVRQQMIEQDAFKAIINLSSDSNRTVKIECCRALCNLCCEESGNVEQRAVRENTPNAIIQIAQTVPSTLPICLQTLVNLSCVNEKYQKVEDVTDALMHFTLPTFHLSEGEEVLLVSAMCNLSAVRNNQPRLVENHCLRVLERTIKSQNAQLRMLSSEVVRNLTTEGRTRSKVMDQNIVSILLGMSKDELEKVKTACVHSFYNLARDVSCREKIVAGGAMTVIIKMSVDKMNNVERDRTAARTLRILCGDKSMGQKLVRDGIVKALMSLIKTDDSVIRQYCAESICSLFQNESVLARLIDQGAVGVLVSLSDNNTDDITGDWCAFALYHLATNKLCPASMLANGILPCLIKLCDTSSTTKTKQFCGAALRVITLQKIVEASSAIPILVHMLRNETDEVIKTNCASALYNLAESDAHCDSMLSAGALMPVVRLTQSDSLQTKIQCAAILSRLSLHEQYYEQFGRDDVLRVLLDLSCLEHTLTQQRVVIAMSNLTQFQSLRLMLLALKATDYIIALASKPDEQIRRGCAAIICNLSYDYGGERAMVAGGVLSTLLITARVTSDQVETKIICIKALVNLQCDRSLYKTMVDKSLIWGLSTLAMLEDQNVLTLCAKALCNLSADFAREMLKSGVAMRAIIRLLKQDNIDMLKDGGKALMNLLLETTDADEVFRLKAVSAVELMASSKDEELIEMCIICLCFASQSDACRTSIIKLRRLRMIDASTIFTKPLVSKAYLTMFGNIANNESMRTQLLDEYSMDRFMHICNSHDPDLDMAVARALYSVTCAAENIPILADQKTLPIISTIWNAEYEKTKEMTRLLVACLYNLTTCEAVQAALVSQSIVSLFSLLWEDAQKEFNMCSLTCRAVCQLGCGNVNTTKMVNDGCAPIICFVTSHRYQTDYSSYHFPNDMNESAAAALRNISCLIPNQATLAQAGVIKTLMDLARPEKEFMPPPSLSIRHNCASSLRSFSYNVDMRETLVLTDAISIILADHNVDRDGDLVMNGNLLREVEAESWSNGSRGPQKESKAPYVAPSDIDTSLLRDTSQADIPVPKSYSVLQKYLVYVYLEEPPIETEEQNMRALNPSARDLVTFKEEVLPDNNFRLCPKQPVELSYEPLHRKFFMEGDLESEDSSHMSEYTADFDPDEGSLQSFTKDNKRNNPHRPGSVMFSDSAGLPLASTMRDRESFSATSSPNLGHSSKYTLPPVIGPGGRGGGGGELPDLGTQISPLTSSRRKKKKKPTTKDDMFKGLVALINHSKAKGSDVDAVVDRWSSMSKF